MAALDKPEHERYAQYRSTGLTQTEAYAKAYNREANSSSQAAATRLERTNEDVRARIKELNAEALEYLDITRQDLIKEAWEIVQLAKRDGQFSPAVAGIDKLAKILGEYAPVKQEVTGKDGGPIQTEANAERLTELLAASTDAEREALRALAERAKND